MTLIEIIAALSVSGFVLWGAILLLDQLTDSAGRIVTHGITAATEGNSARTVRQTLLDVYVTEDSASWFRADAHGAVFSTRCQSAGGWTEPCSASLGVDQRGDSSFLRADLSTGERLLVGRFAGAVAIRYFNPRSADSVWTSYWPATGRIPVALGVVRGTDTLVYPIGAARE